jgi:serine/threonine-protein kinase
MPMSHSNSDQNLLLGVLALQMEFVTRDQLIGAMHEWMRDKKKPLAEVLVGQGILSSKRRTLLDELVQEHLAQHENDPEQSLASVCAREQLRSDLTVSYVRDLHAVLSGPAGGRTPAAGVDGTPRTGKRAADATPDAGEDPEATEPPRVAGGRYTVLRLHAKGGLGQVLIGTDMEMGRTVAIKEIKPRYADDLSSRQRFLAEASITAGLEHPGVVPVYSCGTYADGRPYYAMRLIRGEDLGERIRRFHSPDGVSAASGQRLVELHKLLRRFLDVCNAVQYAHSRGVLHRDLKPSNVMLGKFGETLVVDWGLAKVVGRLETERASEEATLHVAYSGSTYETLFGSAVGTPPYMSPEQAAGRLEEVGPASDVYSLGATLYCLLTGQAPFVDTRARILDQVQRGEFPGPRQVKREVPLALEAICLKAMALVPANRYPSPAKLIEDLEHWLADEPVSAHRETRSERLGRWMRHHRAKVQAGAAALAAVALVLLVATILISRAWRGETLARGAATRSKQEAVMRYVQAREAVDRWLTGAGHALGYYPGMQKTRARLLERAAEDYEQFARQRSDDAELEIERGRTLLRLGHVRLLLRDAAGAKEAYQTAQTLFTELLQRYPEYLDAQVEAANCQTNLGVVLMETGALAAADQAFLTATGQLDPIVQSAADQPQARAALATALLNRGELLAETGRTVEAERALRNAVELLTHLAQPDPQAQEHQVALVSAQDLLGRVLHDRGNYLEAVRVVQAAVDTATRLMDADPANPKYLESRATAHLYLATPLRTLGRFEDEAAAYRRASADYDALCRALPDVPQFLESRALTQTDLGGLLFKLGCPTEAEQELAQAQDVLQRLRAENSEFPRYLDEWGYCRDIQGEILRDRGQGAQAQSVFQEAIGAYEQLLQIASTQAQADVPKYSESLALCQSHLGQTLHLLGQQDAADQAYQTALQTLQTRAAQSPLIRDQLAFVHQHRGYLFADRNQEEAAAREFGLAKDLWLELAASQGAAPEHRCHGAWFLVTCPRLELRDAERAQSLAEALTTDVPGNATYWNCLGAARYRAGRWPAAVEALQTATRLRRADDPRDWFFLALAQRQLKAEAPAREALRRGQQAFEQNWSGNLEIRRIRQEAAELLGE